MVDEKLRRLTEILRSLQSAAVAFSAGVDSTLLTAAAQRVLQDRAIAMTAVSPTLPAGERGQAVDLAARIGIRHMFIEANELQDPDFVRNPANRCYFCKKLRYTLLLQTAHTHGYAWVIDGTNADDQDDYRPGLRAVAELKGIRSPLAEAGFTKKEIRALSKEWELPTWDKPSAACLSSRIAYGEPITVEKLRQVDAAEAVVRQFTSGQVRVRHHGNLARVEVAPSSLAALTEPEAAQQIVDALRKIGFRYVTLDLAGYRMGSMNETLPGVTSRES